MANRIAATDAENRVATIEDMVEEKLERRTGTVSRARNRR
jgi:hypothetical protein